MSLSTIYGKSGKGAQVLTGKSKSLPADSMRVLSQIDGKSNTGAIMATLDKFSEQELTQILTRLLSGGYIRVIADDSTKDFFPDSGVASTIDVVEISVEEFYKAEASAHSPNSEVKIRQQREEAEAKAEAEARAKREAEAREKAERIAREEAEAKAEAEARAKREAEAEAERKAREEAEARAKREAEAREKAERIAREEAEAKAEAEARAKREAEAEAERKAREEAEARAKREAEAREKAERIAREEAEAKAEAEARAKREAEAEAERKAREEAEARAKREAEAREKAERIAREEAEAKAEAEARAKREAEAEAERKAREEAEARAKREAEAREKAERIAREEAEAKAEAEARAKREAEAEAERKAREEAEARAKREAEAEAERKAREEAEARAKREAEAEAERKAREEAEARAKREAEAREKAERIAREEAEAKAEAEALAGQEALQNKATAWLSGTNKQIEEREPIDFSEWPRNALTIGRKLLISVLVTALALLFLLQLVNLSMQVSPLAGPIEKLASANINEPVTIKKIYASLWPKPHLVLDDVTVGSLADIKIATIRVLPVLSTIFDDIKTLRYIEFSGLTIGQGNLHRPLQWMSASNRQGKIKFDQIFLEKTSITLHGLQLPPFDGDIKLTPAGELRSATLSTNSRSTVIQITPMNETYAIDMVADDWQSPIGAPVVFDELHAIGVIDNNQMTFSQIEGRLYGGSLKASMVVDWANQWGATGIFELSEVELEEAMPNFTKEASLKGPLTSSATFTFKANKFATLLDAPEINASFSVDNGAINGIDLVRALRAGNKNDAINGSTRFNKFSGKLLLKDGHYQYKLLALKAGKLEASGEADILANQNLSGEFNVSLAMQSRQPQSHLKLSGKLGSPTLR